MFILSKKILVIDDEKNIRELIKFNLEAEDYKVIIAATGKEGLELIDNSFDLIVLDLMLPEVDGLTVCKKIRNNENYSFIPIIMLTAKSEEVDKILGLEIGADDYITKPFSPRELLARIKAIFRRVDEQEQRKKEKNSQKEIIKVGNLELDQDRHEARKNGDPLKLTPKEFELFKYLLFNKNRVLTRDVLLEKIWGYTYSGDTRTVDVHIRRLRKKIGDGYITTVRGVGYKFVEME
ncbi:MAG TPA: response regulator transcription factor [Halanaerobiales bacterium]|nr:response regulator transcription factor [Halanaerobiales bacterium]